MTNKEFNNLYLISEGLHPKSDYDLKTNVKTYIIPKGDFKQSFKNVLYSLEWDYDNTLDRNTKLFDRFRHRIPVCSDYDCSGQLCGYSQEVQILSSDYDWTVLVFTTYSYDY